MSLLAPALLLGLLGLALPAVAHLLGKQRPLEVRFAAMRFLPQVKAAVTHRRALQDIPLFLVRLGLLALLVLVLARPSSQARGGINMVGEVHDAVILLDASRSTELRVDGKAILERELEIAESLLASLPAGSRVGLVTSDPDGPRVEPTADPSRVRSLLERWAESSPPRPGAWQLRDVVPAAAAMLRGLDDADRKKVVYAIGDATAGGVANLPVATEGGAIVVAIPALEDGTPLPEHVAIVAADWAPAPDLDPRAVRIDAVLHRTTHQAAGAVPVRSVAVGLFIGNTEVARTTVDLGADDDTPVEFTHTMLDGGALVEEHAAATVALLEIDDDPLPSDDRRHLWISADDGIDVAIVNGDPSELRTHDEVFFMTTAITAANADRSIRIRSLAPDQLEDSLRKSGATALADVDVLVLANVRAPAPDVSALIRDRVAAGMGLWVTLGDRVDPVRYNDQLGPLLPLRMRGAVQVGTAPGRSEARAEGVAPADLSHPIFRGVSSELGLSGARANRVMLLDPDPKRDARIALSLTSGAPALLTREVGEGRVALLTTTIDRDWADLPLRPGFVPLVAGTLRYLGGAASGPTGSRLMVGEPRRIRTDAPIVVTTPGGREVSVAPENGFAAFVDTGVPGHYQARVGEAGQSVFAVVVDPEESKTTPLPVAASELDASEQVATQVPRWRWLVLLGALLLALEAVLRWRRHLARVG